MMVKKIVKIKFFKIVIINPTFFKLLNENREMQIYILAFRK